MPQQDALTNLSAGLEANLRRLNPWWRGLPQAPLPPVKRWVFPIALGRLKHGPTKVTVVSGPRQVGKSTLVLQLIQALLAEGVSPDHIFYIQFDVDTSAVRVLATGSSALRIELGRDSLAGRLSTLDMGPLLR